MLHFLSKKSQNTEGMINFKLRSAINVCNTTTLVIFADNCEKHLK